MMTFTANALKISKKGIVIARNVRRISAELCIKHWRQFGDSVWNMSDLAAYAAPSGCIGPDVMNSETRTEQIMDDDSNIRNGL